MQPGRFLGKHELDVGVVPDVVHLLDLLEETVCSLDDGPHGVHSGATRCHRLFSLRRHVSVTCRQQLENEGAACRSCGERPVV
jgi:hypothetical protein